MRIRRSLAALLVAPLAALSIGACNPQTSPSPSSSTAAAAGKTNVVFVLTDDLATNLVQYMPNVQKLAAEGTTFANYTVTDSLCCPSRSSIFTGEYPHHTGVYTNGGSDGGYNTFNKNGDDNSTYATDLQKDGYNTAMMGKYLNGYQPASKSIPPGWTEWDVAGNGYPEYNYNLLQNGNVVHYAKQPNDYLTDVVGGRAQSFIKNSVSQKKPFMIEVATFAPHAPYTPAQQDLSKFPGIKAPRTPAYDALPKNAPAWLASRTPLTTQDETQIDTAFRKRVQAVQAVDRMIGNLETTLNQEGVAKNTEVVFSSDNGYHMGDFRLMPGKQTAYDTDIHVPLIVAGPGVKAGATVQQPAENIDLRPTFDALGGTKPGEKIDGTSLVPLLQGQSPSDWRTTALIEHHGPDTDATDPDMPPKNSGNPPTYKAIRTVTYTYVEYQDGAKEYYDRTTDPYELDNTYASLPAATQQQLHTSLTTLATS